MFFHIFFLPHLKRSSTFFLTSPDLKFSSSPELKLPPEVSPYLSTPQPLFQTFVHTPPHCNHISKAHTSPHFISNSMRWGWDPSPSSVFTGESVSATVALESTTRATSGKNSVFSQGVYQIILCQLHDFSTGFPWISIELPDYQDSLQCYSKSEAYHKKNSLLKSGKLQDWHP